jgi:hypothetical protein
VTQAMLPLCCAKASGPDRQSDLVPWNGTVNGDPKSFIIASI